MENNCDDAAQGRDKEKFVQTVREHKGTIYTAVSYTHLRAHET